MTNGTGTAIVLVMLMQGLAGCSDSRTPTAPRDPPPPPPAPTLKVFTDSAGFSTSDPRDVQDQIVHSTRPNELIWAADDRRLQGYRVETHALPNGVVHFISGAICAEGCAFEVRFGIRDGERGPT